jgi:hypothetical protein
MVALSSPLSLFLMPRRAWLYFCLYLGLSGLVLGLVAWQLVAREGDVRALVLGYFLPAAWHQAAELLIDSVLAQQHRLVLVNALVTTSLMVVTLALFPVKELLSAAFEERGRLLDGEPVREHPLWLQGWQEVKLVLLFLAVQGTIFWLGWQPHPASKAAAVVLGSLFLWFSFAIDFIAPVFQRHYGHYSQIIKTLARYAPSALCFGAVFCAPVLVVAKLWQMNPSWSWPLTVGLLFSANVVCIAWAAAAGTWLGATLYPAFVAARRSHPITRVATWLAVLALLAANGYAFGALGLSVHHKSQLLKCEYSIDFESFGMDKPSLAALLSDRLEVGVHVDVRIHNGTEYDVIIEDSEVVIEHRGAHLATTRLAPLSAPAGQAVTQTLRFTVEATPSMIARGRELLGGDGWHMTLYVDVTPHLRLPIRLLGER